MRLRKNWFSFIIWVLQSVVSATFLAVNVVYTAVTLGFTSSDTLIGFVCLSFVFCFAVYEAMSVSSRFLIHTKILTEARKKRLVQILVVAVFAVSFAMKFAQISKNGFSLNQNDEYYYLALKGTTQTIETQSAIELLYVFVLQSVFMVFGSTPTIAVMFQFFLQQILLILFYFVVKKMSNNAIALMFFIFACTMKSLNAGIYSLSAEPFLLIIVFLTLYYFLIVLDFSRENYERGMVVEILFAVCGFACGFLTAFDILGAVLSLTLFLVLITEMRIKKKEEDELFELHKRMALYALYCLFAQIAGFLLAISLFKAENATLSVALKQYIECYILSGHLDFKSVFLGEYKIVSILMGIFGSMWFFTYLVVPYDFARIGTLMWVGLAVVQMFDMNVIEYPISTSLLWTFMATAGMNGICYYQGNLINNNERKMISFASNVNEKSAQLLAIEPEPTYNGQEDWSQTFQDGRMQGTELDSIYDYEKTELLTESVNDYLKSQTGFGFQTEKKSVQTEDIPEEYMEKTELYDARSNVLENADGYVAKTVEEQTEILKSTVPIGLEEEKTELIRNTMDQTPGEESEADRLERELFDDDKTVIMDERTVVLGAAKEPDLDLGIKEVVNEPETKNDLGNKIQSVDEGEGQMFRKKSKDTFSFSNEELAKNQGEKQQKSTDPFEGRNIWNDVRNTTREAAMLADELFDHEAPIVQPKKESLVGNVPIYGAGQMDWLNVPKKSKKPKKEMKYGFIPEECLMEYDIKELDENDDFDIQ